MCSVWNLWEVIIFQLKVNGFLKAIIILYWNEIVFCGSWKSKIKQIPPQAFMSIFSYRLGLDYFMFF